MVLLVVEQELGASIKPIAFLVVQNEQVRLIQIEHMNSLDKLIDYVPDVFEKIKQVINTKKDSSEK